MKFSLGFFLAEFLVASGYSLAKPSHKKKRRKKWSWTDCLHFHINLITADLFVFQEG
jgi:hypothetical protein